MNRNWQCYNSWLLKTERGMDAESWGARLCMLKWVERLLVVRPELDIRQESTIWQTPTQALERDT